MERSLCGSIDWGRLRIEPGKLVRRPENDPMRRLVTSSQSHIPQEGDYRFFPGESDLPKRGDL